MNQPGFWNDQELASQISKRCEVLRQEVGQWEGVVRQLDELEQLVKLAEEEDDQAFAPQAVAILESIRRSFAALEFSVLLSGPYDRADAILAIHAGTGGVDAQDWASMLLRMLLR